jgi:hypothetical protein
MGNAIRRLMASDVRVQARTDTSTHTTQQMPPPSRKKYVLRWAVPRPGMQSRVMPQRMFAEVEENVEFRLAGAFTEDLTLV